MFSFWDRCFRRGNPGQSLAVLSVVITPFGVAATGHTWLLGT